MDCGIHPGKEGVNGLPYFDAIDDTADIDLILITHFHLDHCASLPYFTEKTNFNGRIFMTHATKAVMKLLLADNILLQSNPLYNEKVCTCLAATWCSIHSILIPFLVYCHAMDRNCKVVLTKWKWLTFIKRSSIRGSLLLPLLLVMCWELPCFQLKLLELRYCIPETIR